MERQYIMVEIRVKVKLTNSYDVTQHRLGALAKDQIRIYEADAMVDTGAVRSVIPSHVLEKLGVGIRGTRVAEYADGRKETVGMSEGITVGVNRVAGVLLNPRRRCMSSAAYSEVFFTVAVMVIRFPAIGCVGAERERSNCGVVSLVITWFRSALFDASK